jgi:hypothetical protein
LTNLDITGHGIDADDNLWIAAGGWVNDNLMQKRNSDGTWTTYLEIDHPVLVRPIGNIISDKEGNIWVTDDQYGAVKFDGTTFTNPVKDNASQLTTADVSRINIDVEGSMYFSHQYGVTKLKDDVWENLTIANAPNEFSSSSASIELDNEGTLWWGSNWYGVFSLTQDIASGIQTNDKILASFSVFPNPSSTFTQISFKIEKTATVQASLFNNMGQKVLDLNIGRLTAGPHLQTINVSDLAKGIYHLQLQLDNKTAIQTIVVQ